MSKPLSDLIPTSWLDPLLTGPDAVLKDGKYRYDGEDIERLLMALKKRLQEAEALAQRPEARLTWQPMDTLPKVEKQTEVLCRFAWSGRDGNEYQEHEVVTLWPDGVLTNAHEEPLSTGERESLKGWMPIPSPSGPSQP